MYAYNLLVTASELPHRYVDVRPGPDMEIPTLAGLREQVRHDLGTVPGWLVEAPADEYIAVEEDVCIHGTWFMLDIEGSEGHILPPLAERMAWERAHS